MIGQRYLTEPLAGAPHCDCHMDIAHPVTSAVIFHG